MFDTHEPTRTVLIVDDEYVPRCLESIALEGTGRYWTLETGNAADALGALEHKRCDCAVIDYSMPDMTGLDLIRMIRSSRQHRNLRIVLMLPDVSEGTELNTAYVGVDRVLSKPVNPWELARVIDELTGATNKSDSVLSIECILRGFPFPTMVLDSNHRVILANGQFYEHTGTGIGSCYVHCAEHMHEDRLAPRQCPLDECLRTNKPAEHTVETVMGDMRVSVYPLAIRVGGRDQLFLHVTTPA